MTHGEKNNEKALLTSRLHYSSGKIVTLSLSQVFYYDNKHLNQIKCLMIHCAPALFVFTQYKQTNNYFAELSLRNNQKLII